MAFFFLSNGSPKLQNIKLRSEMLHLRELKGTEAFMVTCLYFSFLFFCVSVSLRNSEQRSKLLLDLTYNCIATVTVTYHRTTEVITECFVLEGTFKPTQSQPPAVGTATTHQLSAQGPIQPGPECLQGWGTTASLGSCASASLPSE